MDVRAFEEKWGELKTRVAYFIRVRRFTAAEQILRFVLQEAPEISKEQVLVELATVLALQDRFTESLEVFDQVLRRNPQNWMALSCRQIIFSDFDRFDLVRSPKPGAIDLNSDSLLDQILAQIDAALEKRDMDLAQNLALSSLNAHKDNPQILERLGVISFCQNRLKDARSFFSKALGRDPHNRVSHFHLSVLDQKSL